MSMSRLLLVLSALSLAFALAPRSEAEAGAPWLVLLYVAADNDLQPEYAEELASVSELRRSGHVDVVILFDRGAGVQSGEAWDPRLPCWRGARAFHVGPSGLETLWTADQWNTGSAGDLERFLNDATCRYPARRTALFLVDHGHPLDGTCSDHGAVKDDQDDLRIGELKAAIGGHVARRGPLDLLVFASCQMGVLETAASMSDQVRHVVASEDLLWTQNFDYRAIVSRLALDPEVDGRGLGEICLDVCRCVNDPAEVAADPELGPRQSLSVLCLLDCAGVPALVRSLVALGRALHDLRAQSPALWAALVEMRIAEMDFGCQCFYVPATSCTGRGGCFIDLQHLVRGIRAALPGALEAELSELERAVQGAVIRSTPNPLFDGACGLGVMLPTGALPPRYVERIPADFGPWVAMLRDFEKDQPKPGAGPRFPRLQVDGGTFRFLGPSRTGLSFVDGDSPPVAEATYGFLEAVGSRSSFSGFLPLSRGPATPGVVGAPVWPRLVGESGGFRLPIRAVVGRAGKAGDLLVSSLVRRTTPSGESEDLVILSRLGAEELRVIGVGRAVKGSLPISTRIRPGDLLTPYGLTLDESAPDLWSSVDLALAADGRPIADPAAVRVGAGGLRLRWEPVEPGTVDPRVGYRAKGTRPRIEAPAR